MSFDDIVLTICLAFVICFDIVLTILTFIDKENWRNDYVRLIVIQLNLSPLGALIGVMAHYMHNFMLHLAGHFVITIAVYCGAISIAMLYYQKNQEKIKNLMSIYALWVIIMQVPSYLAGRIGVPMITMTGLFIPSIYFVYKLKAKAEGLRYIRLEILHLSLYLFVVSFILGFLGAIVFYHSHREIFLLFEYILMTIAYALFITSNFILRIKERGLR